MTSPLADAEEAVGVGEEGDLGWIEIVGVTYESTH